jgi:DNA-binding NarL/FixJ family response regulator
MANILLISHRIRSWEVKQLTRHGHRITARMLSGAQALGAPVLPASQLLLLDLELPDVHGLELLQMLYRGGQLPPGIPVLVRSRLASPASLAHCRNAGVTGFLRTGDEAVLLEVIDSVLNGALVFPDQRAYLTMLEKSPGAPVRLSIRQLAILYGLHRGHDNQQLGQWLDVTPNAIQQCRFVLQRQFRARDLESLFHKAENAGFLDPALRRRPDLRDAK